MAEPINIMELADELAEIARSTTDGQTGLRLIQIVERLLREAGLPPDDEGGGEAPTGRLSEPSGTPA